MQAESKMLAGVISLLEIWVPQFLYLRKHLYTTSVHGVKVFVHAPKKALKLQAPLWKLLRWKAKVTCWVFSWFWGELWLSCYLRRTQNASESGEKFCPHLRSMQARWEQRASHTLPAVVSWRFAQIGSVSNHDTTFREWHRHRGENWPQRTQRFWEGGVDTNQPHFTSAFPKFGWLWIVPPDCSELLTNSCVLWHSCVTEHHRK